MSVIRKHHNKNYTVMSNYHFMDKNLSLKAKGLLSLMLSLPEDWDYSTSGLETLSSDGNTSVRSALHELEEHEYLFRERTYENGKISDWTYHIFECRNDYKQFKQQQDEQHVENQHVESNNNKILNKQNTKKVNKKDSSINTTVGFLGSNKKQPKQNLYSKLTALIDGFTDNLKVRQALREFLNLQLEIYKDEGKTFYVNVWKNRLNKLKNEFKEDEWLAVIQYATSKGWQNFYSIPTYDNKKSRSCNHDVRKGKAWEENVVSAKMTEAERQADEEEADRLEAMGIRARF